MYSATASNPNSFDTDLAPAHPPQSSADTSVSSVATEPHTVMAEPSTRRRVSPIAEVLVCEPRPKQNNPYMYNVLGANASPDLAARTSPIPPAPLSPTQQQAHNASYGDISTAYEMDPAAHWQPNAPTAAVTRPLPVLGGYMAARYTSAFPPGQLPVLQQQQPPVAVAPRAASPLEQPQDVGAQGSSRRRNSRRTVAASNPTLTLSDDSPRSPLSPAPTPSSPTTNSPTSTFKVMYRNGRPVPVPATANATAPAAATAPA